MENLDDYEAFEDVSPRLLSVRRADSGIVTVADVVEQLSTHLIAHKGEILEATEPLIHAETRGAAGELRTSNPALPVDQEIPVGTRIFFNRFFGKYQVRFARASGSTVS